MSISLLTHKMLMRWLSIRSSDYTPGITRVCMKMQAVDIGLKHCFEHSVWKGYWVLCSLKDAAARKTNTHETEFEKVKHNVCLEIIWKNSSAFGIAKPKSTGFQNTQRPNRMCNRVFGSSGLHSVYKDMCIAANFWSLARLLQFSDFFFVIKL